MTSISTKPIPTDGASASPSGIVAALRDRRGSIGPVLGWAMLAILGIAFTVLFFEWLDRQLGPGGFSAKFFQDWGHAYVVPLISLAYVWKERERLARTPACTYWPGLAVMLLGLACYLFFILGFPNHMFQGASMLLTLAGVVLLVAGPHVFRVLAFPIAYLAFGVTISQQIMEKVTWPLKLFASQGAYVMLRVFGVEVERQGNVLEVFVPATLEMRQLNVAEACSGMRMVVAFIALSVAVAFFSCRQWWQRIGVVLLAVPVALFMNIVRVAILGGLTLVNPDLSVGESHTLIGTLLLFPAFLLFMLCVWILKKIAPDEETSP